MRSGARGPARKFCPAEALRHLSGRSCNIITVLGHIEVTLDVESSVEASGMMTVAVVGGGAEVCTAAIQTAFVTTVTTTGTTAV